jgi:hypothetical protein
MVRSGDLSELDVLVSSILARHGVGGYESLHELENKLVIIASEEDAPKIIGFKGKMALEISKKLGRRVVVLVGGWGDEDIIRSLVKPNRLVATNRVYKPDGKEVLKLIFDKPLDEGTVQLMKELVGDVEIEYEKDTHVR